MATSMTSQESQQLLDLIAQDKVEEAISKALNRVDPESEVGIQLSVLEVRWYNLKLRKMGNLGAGAPNAWESNQIKNELNAVIADLPQDGPKRSVFVQQAFFAVLLLLLTTSIYLKVSLNQTESALETEKTNFNKALLFIDSELKEQETMINSLQTELAFQEELSLGDPFQASEGGI